MLRESHLSSVMSLSDVSCEDAVRALDQRADPGGDQELPGPLATHIERCLHCQVTEARQRRIAHLLGQMGNDTEPVDPAWWLDVLVALDDLDERTERRHQLAGRAAVCLGGLASAAGVAAGVVAYANRGRRLLAG